MTHLSQRTLDLIEAREMLGDRFEYLLRGTYISNDGAACCSLGALCRQCTGAFMSDAMCSARFRAARFMLPNDSASINDHGTLAQIDAMWRDAITRSAEMDEREEGE